MQETTLQKGIDFGGTQRKACAQEVGLGKTYNVFFEQ